MPARRWRSVGKGPSYIDFDEPQLAPKPNVNKQAFLGTAGIFAWVGLLVAFFSKLR